MNKSVSFLFIGLICLLISCTNEKQSLSFPETENLYVTRELDTENIFMRYPFRIRLIDSILYVMDLHAYEYCCHKFYYPSMKYKQSFIKRGQGPGEFTYPDNIRLAWDSTCWILDANNARLTCFRNDNPDSLMKEIRLDKRLIRTLDFDFYNDSMFIVPDYTGIYRFSILNPDGTIKENRGQIPLRGKKNKKIPDIAYAQAWRGFISYNENNGLLAIATQLGNVLEIYDIRGDSLVNVIYGEEGEPDFFVHSGGAIPNGIMGYTDVYNGDKYIYAIFCNRTFKEIRTRTQQIEGGNNIYVFDHYGNPVKHYILDRYITGFYVDEKNNVIFGLDVNSDYPIVEYSLQ